MLKEYPLGECELKYTLESGTPVTLGLTLKDEETIFSSNVDIYKIEVDQLDGPYRAFYTQGETTFKCSSILDMENLEKLTPVYEKGTSGYAMSTAGKEVKFGKLEIHPISAGSSTDYDITGPKVLCKVEVQIEYKKEGKAKCNLTFEFSADDKSESPTYRKVFTVGKYQAGA